MALRAMEQHYAFYGQLNGVTKVEGYVTRNAIIHCDCGNADIRLDVYEDHGVIAANGEPVLTCDDCQANINIFRFGLCDAEEKYGKLSALRPSGEKEMNEEGIMCYRCMPVLAEKWRQKESDLLIGDVDSGEFAEALKAGAYLTCRYGGIIEVVEVPNIEVSEMDNEESEGILPLESKWLEEHTRDMDDIEYVSMEFLNELGWTEIADYFMDKETGERSDWKRAYNEDKGIFEFDPDPEVKVHRRPINKQDVINLNRVLVLYNINKSKELVCAFMSQINIECGSGAKMCEQVGKGNIQPKNTTRTEMKVVHEILKDYPYKFRGGGVIQITNVEIYKEVFRKVAEISDDIKDDILDEMAEQEYIGDEEGTIEEEKILTIGTEYVAYNYPWLSAGIFWEWKKINEKFKDDKMDGVINEINYYTSDREERKGAYDKCMDIYKEYADDIPWETENE